MYEYIECYKDGDNTKWHAHKIKNLKYLKIFKCGICGWGDISLDKVHKKINKSNCDICGCNFLFATSREGDS